MWGTEGPSKTLGGCDDRFDENLEMRVDVLRTAVWSCATDVAALKLGRGGGGEGVRTEERLPVWWYRADPDICRGLCANNESVTAELQRSEKPAQFKATVRWVASGTN